MAALRKPATKAKEDAQVERHVSESTDAENGQRDPSHKSSSSSSRYAMSDGSPKYSSRCGLDGPRNLQLERTLFGNRLPEPELFRRPEERQGWTRQKLLDKALPETAIALMETAGAERLRYERFDESSARIFAE